MAEVWRDKYAEDIEELKTLASRQSSLIHQLKEECVALTSKLQTVSNHLETESQRLTS